MTHLCCVQNAAQEPAYSPPPGVQSIAPLESGARAGRYRSPDTGAVVTETPTGEPQWAAAVTPYIRPPGVPKPLNNPMAYLVRLVRPFTGAVASTGEHQEFDAGASTPQGEQRPPRTGTARGNTWRAKPAPWDAATFVVGEG